MIVHARPAFVKEGIETFTKVYPNECTMVGGFTHSVTKEREVKTYLDSACTQETTEISMVMNEDLDLRRFVHLKKVTMKGCATLYLPPHVEYVQIDENITIGNKSSIVIDKLNVIPNSYYQQMAYDDDDDDCVIV